MKKGLLPLTLCLFTMGSVSAQDHTPELDSRVIKALEEVLIGHKIHFTPFKSPVTFQVLQGDDLKARSVGQEPSFLLAETPSVTNYSDGGNSQGYSYFRLRGIDQTRINMTLDGAPMNEPEDQGAYFSNYPDLFNSLDGVLITRGVGTSRHGVASYAGSIALFAPTFKDSMKTTIGLGYGSFNSYRIFGEYTSGKRRRALYIRASQVASDGYKRHSSNNSQSVFLSSMFFGKKTEWKINALVGQQRNKLAWLGVSDSMLSIDRRTNLNENEKDRFFQSFIQLQNKYLFKNTYNSPVLSSSIYYTFLDGNYDFNMNSFLGLPGTDELYNYALRSNLLGAFVNYEYSHNLLDASVGIHANTYQRRHIGSEQSLGELYRNRGYKNEISGFIKLQYTFLRLTLFGDLQLRHVDFDYAGSVEFQKLNWNFLNPKLGWSYRVKKRGQLYYSIGKVGREPTRNDLFGGNDDLLTDSLGNPLIFNRTPEYVVDQELGFRYLKKKTSINVNLYYMDFRNEIVLDGKFGPNGLALTNKVDKSFRTGIEASIRFQFFKNFSSITNASYNYSRIKEQTVSFTPILTPPVIVNQEFIYTLKGFSVSVSGRYQDRSFIDFANTAQINGYFLLNARLGYQVRGFDFGVFFNNLTNANYYSNGYVDYDGSRKYFVQAPANFYGSVKYSF
ncbi:Vitamin B12 transporter BtuB [compost metagenome]